MFCPKCGSILRPKLKAGARIMGCSCGYEEKKAKFTIREAKREKEADIEVVEKEEERHLPLTDALCQKCGHGKARYWLVQTRAGDEAETKFYKCEKCRHVWREYD